MKDLTRKYFNEYVHTMENMNASYENYKKYSEEITHVYVDENDFVLYLGYYDEYVINYENFDNGKEAYEMINDLLTKKYNELGENMFENLHDEFSDFWKNEILDKEGKDNMKIKHIRTIYTKKLKSSRYSKAKDNVEIIENFVSLDFYKSFTSDENIKAFKSRVSRTYESIGFVPTTLVMFSPSGEKYVDEFIFLNNFE